MKKNKILLLIPFLVSLVMGGCKKQEGAEAVIPEVVAHFTNVEVANFYVQNTANAVFKIPIGITTPVSTETKITVSVSSPTGAAAGTQYNLPSTTVTIPAGQTLDSLPIQGLFAGFPGTRIDTLVFKITGGSVSAASYNDTYKLVLQKYCPVDITTFGGAYANVNDNDGSPVYRVTVAPITAANLTSPTKGFIIISGLWGVTGSGPIRVNLDWTDPGNFKTDIPSGQPLYVDGTYGQAFVRPVGSGTFSSCTNTFTLKYQVYVSAGSFAATTTSMAR